MTDSSDQNQVNPNSSPSHEILPIGTVLGIDSEGYIVSESSPDMIKAPWDAPVAELKEAYAAGLGNKLHSIYIRGSVGRGNAIENMSDLDGLVVVYGKPKDIDWEWANQFDKTLQEKYPFVKGVDVEGVPYEALLAGNDKDDALMIKIMAACVYGKDLGPQLPKIRPGPDAVMACKNIAKRTLPTYLDNEPTSTAQKMKWSAKQILRAGFELVMEEEQCYTRDLYPCYELFSKHYPEMASVMHRALEMALWPTDDQAAFLALLNDIGPWLSVKAQEKYPAIARGI